MPQSRGVERDVVAGGNADVAPPKLLCPRDVDVTVAGWTDNSTIVHYDARPLRVSDNSGQFEYRVVGVPDRQRRFTVGRVALTYEAFDDAGNTASCVQYVRVRGRPTSSPPSTEISQ